MSPHRVKILGTNWNSAEHAFQALRLPVGHPVRNNLNNHVSPMDVKRIINNYRNDFVIKERSDDDLDLMRWVTEEKLIQNNLVDELISTGDQLIVEDVTSRYQRGNNSFWGAAWIDNQWIGDNWLGRIWMEHRDEMNR